MAITFGQLRMSLHQTPAGAGAHLDVLTNYINQRYRMIYDSYQWTRLRGSSTLQTVAKYDTGTVAVTGGSTAVTLTGGTFPANLDGARMRIAGRNEFYTFTRATGTTGTLDRNYEGSDASAAGYRLWKAVYSLPSDLDIITSLKEPTLDIDLDPVEQEDLDNRDAFRQEYGPPTEYLTWVDDSSNLPQVELYPGPEAASGLPILYRKKLTLFAVTDTGVAFPDWINSACLFYGVQADLLADKGDLAGSQVKEAQFAAVLNEMQKRDSERIAWGSLEMSEQYTYHRKERSTPTLSARWRNFRNYNP